MMEERQITNVFCDQVRQQLIRRTTEEGNQPSNSRVHSDQPETSHTITILWHVCLTLLKYYNNCALPCQFIVSSGKQKQ